jgi:hypothetical protein
VDVLTFIQPTTGRGAFDGWEGRIHRACRPCSKTQALLTFDIEDDNHDVLRSNQAITLDTYGYDIATALRTLAGGLKLEWLDQAVEWASGGDFIEIARRLNSGVYADGATLYRDNGGIAQLALRVAHRPLATAPQSLSLERDGGDVGLSRPRRNKPCVINGFVTKPGSSTSFDLADGQLRAGASSTPIGGSLYAPSGRSAISGTPHFFDPTYGSNTQFPQELILWNLIPGRFCMGTGRAVDR